MRRGMPTMPTTQNNAKALTTSRAIDPTTARTETASDLPEQRKHEAWSPHSKGEALEPSIAIPLWRLAADGQTQPSREVRHAPPSR